MGGAAPSLRMESADSLWEWDSGLSVCSSSCEFRRLDGNMGRYGKAMVSLEHSQRLKYVDPANDTVPVNITLYRLFNEGTHKTHDHSENSQTPSSSTHATFSDKSQKSPRPEPQATPAQVHQPHTQQHSPDRDRTAPTNPAAASQTKASTPSQSHTH